MNIWFIVWFLIAVFLFGFTAWSFALLQRQKKSWRAFAKRYKLRYQPGAMMDSPNVSGLYDGYTLGVFVDTHGSVEDRRARRLSAIEITLHSTMGTDGALASADMVQIVQDLNFKSEVKPDHPDWKDDYICMTSAKPVMDTYLTRERLDHITGLMKRKNAAVIYIFRPDIMLLRYDTPEPLETPQKLDRIVKQMIAAAKALETEDALPASKALSSGDDADEAGADQDYSHSP